MNTEREIYCTIPAREFIKLCRTAKSVLDTFPAWTDDDRRHIQFVRSTAGGFVRAYCASPYAIMKADLETAVPAAVDFSCHIRMPRFLPQVSDSDVQVFQTNGVMGITFRAKSKQGGWTVVDQFFENGKPGRREPPDIRQVYEKMTGEQTKDEASMVTTRVNTQFLKGILSGVTLPALRSYIDITQNPNGLNPVRLVQDKDTEVYIMPVRVKPKLPVCQEVDDDDD